MTIQTPPCEPLHMFGAIVLNLHVMMMDCISTTTQPPRGTLSQSRRHQQQKRSNGNHQGTFSGPGFSPFWSRRSRFDLQMDIRHPISPSTLQFFCLPLTPVASPPVISLLLCHIRFATFVVWSVTVATGKAASECSGV